MNKRKTNCFYCKKELQKGEGYPIRVRVNWVGNGNRFTCAECDPLDRCRKGEKTLK